MVKLSEIKEGKKFSFTYGPVTREMITEYGLASGDKNPIHMNEEFAINVGKLGGVIAHGMLSFGIINRFLSDLVGDGKVISTYAEMRGMIRPGDSWIVNFTVKKIEGKKVTFEILEEGVTKLRIEKNGQVVKKFEADEKNWFSEKEIAKGVLKKEETPEGTLIIFQRQALPGEAVAELV